MNVKDIKNLKTITAFFGNFAIYATTDFKEGLINRNGEIVGPAEKYEAIFHCEDDVFELWLNFDGVIRPATYFDAKLGKEVPAPKRIQQPQIPELPEAAKQYEEARWCVEGRIVFGEGKLYGIMDENGKIIVPPTFDYVAPSIYAKRDRIRVQKDNREAYIGLDGQVIIPFEYPYVNYNHKLGVHVFHTDEDKWGMMDKDGKIIIPAIYDYLDAREYRGLDEISVKKDGRCYFINAKQEEVKVF